MTFIHAPLARVAIPVLTLRVYTIAFTQSILEATLIPIAVGESQNSLPMLLVIFPHAHVDATIRPSHFTRSVAHISFPLAVVLKTGAGICHLSFSFSLATFAVPTDILLALTPTTSIFRASRQ